MTKKCQKKKNTKIIFELNYRPENVKEIQKLFLFQLVKPFSSIQKINQRIWFKILHNIAVKLVTG